MKPERIQDKARVVERARSFANGLGTVLDAVEALVQAVRALFGLSSGKGDGK